MSDENEFVYRNENTGDIARYPYRSARLEMLPNWTTLQTPEGKAETEPPHAPPAPETPPEPTVTDPGTQTSPAPAPATIEPVEPVSTPEPHSELAGGGDGNGPDAAPERPARSAPKADWQAYARERAQDSNEEAAIDGLTKEQLIEQYGGGA